MTYRTLAALFAALAVAACDTGVDRCEPAAALGTGPTDGSLAIESASGCAVEPAGASSGPAPYLFGPERDFEEAPTHLVRVVVPTQDGPRLRLGFGGADRPAPGRYPVMDLRGPDGRFGPLPARFHPDSVYAFTSRGTGEGYWFATGGEVVVERSDEGGVVGTAEVTLLHGGGGRPLTARARFRAEAGETAGYGQFSNPHDG